MDQKLSRFCQEYSNELERGTAAIFVGAGFSTPAGYVNWKELLRDVATDLGLDIDQESDLVAIAQYHVNENNRSRLNRLLIEEFTQHVKPTRNHELLATIPIRTVWTTNYDSLLEDAFRVLKKLPDVKRRVSQLATSLPGRDVVVYKMHGDREEPADAVLTKEDYELYQSTRGLFASQLQGDLISKTFLFLGFSFTDPNIDYVLSRVRGLLGADNQRTHYCIMRRPQAPADSPTSQAQHEYDRRRLQLRMSDLKRYSITPLLIDDYKQITEILEELSKRSYFRSVFVSGSAHEYGSLGRDRLEGLSHDLGYELIRRGKRVVTGLGMGLGQHVLHGALEAIYSSDHVALDDRLTIRPFPRGSNTRGIMSPEMKRRYRQDMVSKAGFAVFMAGNKWDQQRSATILGTGVQEEFEIATLLNRYPIPIGGTGYAARIIWEEVNAKLDHYYPGIGVKPWFETLGDNTRTNSEWIEAVFGIIDKVSQSKR